MTIHTVIEQKLQDAFSPFLLDVINESSQHNVPPGSESHFKVIIVSNQFDGKRLIARHRMVNEVLATELAEHIHALAIHTYTEQQWQDEYKDKVPLSPRCMGGSKLG